MEITPSHQQKIDRLEAERRQLEDRIRRLKRAAQTAERKRLTRAKIILGALVLRDHQPLLRQLITEASPQDAELLRSVFFPQAAKEAPPIGRLAEVSGHPCTQDFRATGAFSKKGEAHLRIAGSPPRRPCAPPLAGRLATASRTPVLLSYKPETPVADMAIFHLSIRPISGPRPQRADRHLLDTRSKLTNERTGEKHDWSRHKADVIEWQIIGPAMPPGELAARAERAEKRWDARVGRAMDVALPHELNTKAQWELSARVRPSIARHLWRGALR